MAPRHLQYRAGVDAPPLTHPHLQLDFLPDTQTGRTHTHA